MPCFRATTQDLYLHKTVTSEKIMYIYFSKKLQLIYQICSTQSIVSWVLQNLKWPDSTTNPKCVLKWKRIKVYICMHIFSDVFLVKYSLVIGSKNWDTRAKPQNHLCCNCYRSLSVDKESTLYPTFVLGLCFMCYLAYSDNILHKICKEA